MREVMEFSYNINTCLKVSYPNNVMYAVDITVSNVDSDGSESKAIFLSGAVDGNGGAQHTDCWEKVSAG